MEMAFHHLGTGGSAQRPSWFFRTFLGAQWIIRFLLLVLISAAGCDGFAGVNDPSRLALAPLTMRCPRRSRLCVGGRFDRSPQTRKMHQKNGKLRQPLELRAVPVSRGVFGPGAASSSMYMVLLALQFGLQPILTQRYAGRETSILKTTYVGVQDVTRFILCGVGLLLSLASTSTGSLTGFLAAAATAVRGYRPSWEVLVPAILYNVQNYCSITAYQSLDAITYNVLNQTKTLFAALWCFALLRQRQSIPQMVALVALVVAAFIMESNQQSTSRGAQPTPTDNRSPAQANDERETASVQPPTNAKSRTDHRQIGVLAVLAASMTSGLAGAWTQRCLQGRTRSCNALVFSMELSVISLSLLVGTALGKRWVQPNSRASALEANGAAGTTASVSLRARLFRGWTIKTWVPVITNSLGGILVGLVTKHAGVVPKGFALIIGLFLSGLLQNSIQRTHVSSRQWLGGTMAGLSLYLHAAFPPAP